MLLTDVTGRINMWAAEVPNTDTEELLNKSLLSITF